MSHILRRSTDTPKPARLRIVAVIIYGALISGIAALPISLNAAIKTGRLSAARDEDRKDDAIASCKRGNEFRSQVRGIGTANGERIDKILALFLPPVVQGATDRFEALRAQLDALKVSYDESVTKVADTNCSKVVTS